MALKIAKGGGLVVPRKPGKPPLDMLGGFFKDETGASAVEYTFLLALLAMVIMLGLTTLGQTLANMFTSFANLVSTTTGS